MFFCVTTTVSQTLEPYFANQKMGYKSNGQVIIEAQYDTALVFDKTNRIALVANKDLTKKITNPITGEENYSWNYFYINKQNKKVKLKAKTSTDSIITFNSQQEFQYSYKDSTDYFKILYQDKVYLFSKNGKQLTEGFDNIMQTKLPGLFMIEKFVEFEKKRERTKGLVDSVGKVIVKCKYREIVINTTDSVIYSCSAVFNDKPNDDVFNYSGKLIYSSQKHIAYASKNIHVIKSYAPRNEMIIENTLTNQYQYIDADYIQYLQKNTVLYSFKENWYIIDVVTLKKQKVDKNLYYQFLNKLMFH